MLFGLLRVNREHIKFLVGLLLFWPVVSWAHELSPSYYPLGPLPFYIGAGSWPYLVLIPISVAVETFVLWICLRKFGMMGNLWRAAVLYIVARAAETAAIFLSASIPLFRNPGWTSSFVWDYGPLALFFSVGLAAAVAVGLSLYRQKGAKSGLIVAAVCTASSAGYLSAIGYSLILLKARIF